MQKSKKILSIVLIFTMLLLSTSVFADNLQQKTISETIG